MTPGRAVAFPGPDRRRHYAPIVDATTWFIIALVALLLGVVLLVADRVRARGGDRDRRRWAELRGWEFLENDPVLPSRWRYGTIHQGGPGIARDLISGEVPTPDGPRQGYAFDHEQAGRVGSVVAAVQLKTQLPGAVELRLPPGRRGGRAGPVGAGRGPLGVRRRRRGRAPPAHRAAGRGRRRPRRGRRGAVGRGLMGARHCPGRLAAGARPGPAGRPRRGRHRTGAGPGRAPPQPPETAEPT